MDRDESHVALLANDGYSDSSSQEDIAPIPKHRNGRTILDRILSQWFPICLLLTGINFYANRCAVDNQVLTFRELGKLRRPNQFIQLESIPAFDYPLKAKTLYPNVLSIVDKAKPNTVYGDSADRFARYPIESRVLLPPEDRLFKVTSQYSTIFEFTTVDYNMENCELHIVTPDQHVQNSSFILGEGPNQIDVWALKLPFNGYVDQKTLSYSTRPPRMAKLGTGNIEYGTQYVYPWKCPLNSRWAFEISSTNDQTHVEWSQDHEERPARIVVVQRQSA